MKPGEEHTKSITVHVATRPYPLKISAADELVIRKIVKEVNEKINHFQLAYAHKDLQDCVAMALLTYAVELYQSSLEPTDISGLEHTLYTMESLLEQALTQCQEQ